MLTDITLGVPYICVIQSLIGHIELIAEKSVVMIYIKTLHKISIFN